jgi:hypothetical protein
MSKKSNRKNNYQLKSFEKKMDPSEFVNLVKNFLDEADKKIITFNLASNKRFWEEIYPISVLINHLDDKNHFHQSIISVEYTGNNSSKFDAYIELKNNETLSIDVTCDSNENDALVMEHINEHGMASPLDPIGTKCTRAAHKNGTARTVKQDNLLMKNDDEIFEQVKQRVQIIKESLNKKSKKNKKPNIILINHGFSRGISELHDDLIRIIKEYLQELKNPFDEVFLIYYLSQKPIVCEIKID